MSAALPKGLAKDGADLLEQHSEHKVVFDGERANGFGPYNHGTRLICDANGEMTSLCQKCLTFKRASDVVVSGTDGKSNGFKLSVGTCRECMGKQRLH